jgi:hypothetical protein
VHPREGELEALSERGVAARKADLRSEDDADVEDRRDEGEAEVSDEANCVVQRREADRRRRSFRGLIEQPYDDGWKQQRDCEEQREDPARSGNKSISLSFWMTPKLSLVGCQLLEIRPFAFPFRVELALEASVRRDLLHARGLLGSESITHAGLRQQESRRADLPELVPELRQ